MAYYIHFVGKGFYSIDEFRYESENLGVSRRVPLKLLANLEWGDTIYLCQGDLPSTRRKAPVKTTTVFGYFRLERIAIPEWSFCNLSEMMELTPTGPSSDIRVVRGCGSYILGQTASVRVPIRELYENLVVEAGINETFILLQGAFHPVNPVFKLKNLHWQQGLRRINVEDLGNQLAAILNHPKYDPDTHFPLITGLLEPTDKLKASDDVPLGGPGLLQEVKNYKLRSLDQGGR